MTYILKNSSRTRTFPRILGIVALLVVLYTLFIFFGATFWRITQTSFAYILKLSNGITRTLTAGTQFLEPQAALIKENETLKAENASLKAASLNQSVFSSLYQETKTDLIQVYPLSFPPRTPYDTILLDTGEAEGVREGATVFLEPSIEIGTIDQVSSHTARVQLLSSSLMHTEAVVARTGEVVELLGNGGNNFKLEVPLSFDIQEGDLFTRTGEHHSIIAQVKSIKRDQARSTLTAFAALPLPITGNTALYVEP